MRDKQHVTSSGRWNDWKREAETALRGKAFESLYTSTYEGIELQPLYDSYDTDNKTKAKNQILNSATNEWKISQEIVAECQEGLSEKIKMAKTRGQTSFFIKNLNILQNRDDLLQAMQHIDWKKDRVFFDINGNLCFATLLLNELKESKNINDLKGVIAFDPYEELLINGKSSVDLSTKLDYLADLMKWTDENQLSTKTLLIKGSLYHEAGASAVQELVYSFSHALDVLNELLNRNVLIDTIARSTVFSFATGSHFFMEIAKFRAAKEIWASLIAALGGSEESQKIYIHAKTSTFNKTKYDRYVNLLRTTTEGFAAAVAGIDELTLDSFDSVFNKNSQLGERVARNSQFILQEESLLSGVVDPAAGSYYVETLTHQLAEKAWNEIKELDSFGGFLEALKKGFIQKNLNEKYKEKVRDLNNRNLQVIGTNVFANPNDQVEMDDSRNMAKKPSHLNQVYSFNEAMNYVNIEKKVPELISKNINTQLSIKPLQIHRLVEHFEQLRNNVTKYKMRTGIEPKVLIVTVGILKNYKTNLDFINGLLTAGGIYCEVIPYEQINEVKQKSFIIFCGKESDYDLIKSKDVNRLKTEDSFVYVTMVGNFSDEKIENFGMDGRISSNIDVYEFLRHVHDIMGVK
ncbi:methylmalonyl-CoA mutase family protein [Metabacillus litoralis]|uniref:methylmalonyl-CoA mutase family protein n=1 Tax=Metabacillus litoralis TaxID=152268 RepID=UPI001CFD4577|nr:methylmalonyl-CoA mutase family protein [Metabacillus litoralis]